jgi:hypothetical protein
MRLAVLDIGSSSAQLQADAWTERESQRRALARAHHDLYERALS